MSSDGPRWSSDIGQAGWIGPRLTAWRDGYVVSIVVPGGFEAYARVLHPAETPDYGERLVRWADVAAWSGLPLRRDAQFHSIALPPADPGGPPPYEGCPEDGSLYAADAMVLAGILRDWTSAPEDCWFCVWDGFGWGTIGFAGVTETGQPVESIEGIPGLGRDPIPALVREGPRVRLPNRDYFLYQGPAEAVAALTGLDRTRGQSPNLWWPADRAWCVATEIDLPWTYVGGPRGLIDAILADDRIETLPAEPDDPLNRVEDWVTAWADQLTDELLARGSASLGTPRGTIDARLRRPQSARPQSPRPQSPRDGELQIRTSGRDGSGSSGSSRTPLRCDEERLRSEVHHYLMYALLDLTRM